MDQMIPLNLLIGDRSYRIRIKPADEEVVRRTAKMINEKLVEYKTQFAGKDMQDYIAMVLIWFATEQGSDNPGLADFSSIASRLQALERLVDGSLGEKTGPV